MSTNQTNEISENVNTEDAWVDPSRTINGITITAFSEESEGAYLCLESDGKTVNRGELALLITALTELIDEAGE